MSATYIYTPDCFERITAPDIAKKVKENGFIRVRLSKAPSGGKGLHKSFRWVEDMDGNFIGMVRRACLEKE